MSPLVLWLSCNGLLLVIAYLLGSLPTGYLLGRWLKGIDIREYGSGSTGATNVLRTLGKGPGATVLAVDVLKGVGAIALTQFVYTQAWLINAAPSEIAPETWLPWMVVLAGFCCLLGHSKSIWLNFTGGKSVATSLGILLMLNWQVGLAMMGIFATVIAIFRIVSLSSILAALVLPLLMYGAHQPLAYIVFGVVGGLYVVWRHSTNIERLLAGTEPRVGDSSPT